MRTIPIATNPRTERRLKSERFEKQQNRAEIREMTLALVQMLVGVGVMMLGLVILLRAM